MFQLIRKAALLAFGVARRFYLATPATPYEAILFNHIKSAIALLFFREVPRGTV
jgi:hypothetical protein